MKVKQKGPKVLKSRKMNEWEISAGLAMSIYRFSNDFVSNSYYTQYEEPVSNEPLSLRIGAGKIH